MELNYLLYLSLVIVSITSLPHYSPTKETTGEAPESLVETPDPHDETSILENLIFLGSLESEHSEAYGVSGNIYVVNCTTLYVEDFSYDGTGIRVNWVAVIEPEIKKQESNIIIPDEEGHIDRIQRAYENESFYLYFQENQSLAGVKWISFLCQSFNLDLGSVSANKSNCETQIDEIVDPCAEGNYTIVDDEDTYELGELFGEYRPTFYSLDYEVNGTFYTVKDNPHQIYIRNFSYNGNAPLVYFYFGLTLESGKNNFYVPRDYHTYDPCDIQDGFLSGIVHKHVNQSLILNLPQDYTIHNIRWVMIWCRVFALDMGHVWNDHYRDSYSRRKRESGSSVMADVGKLGSFDVRMKKDGDTYNITSPTMYGVKGDLYAINSTTLFLSNFTYNGEAPDAYFYAGSTEVVGGNGTIIPDEKGNSSSPLGAYENQNVTLRLPDGHTIKDFKWISIFCDAFLEDFGHVNYSHLDLDEMLNKLEMQPIDSQASENTTESINILEKTDESNVSEESIIPDESEVNEEFKQETDTVMVQENEPEEEQESIPKPYPVPEPEPGEDGYLRRAEKSESNGMVVSLSYTCKYVILITIALFNL